jgi:hypothetical protein
VNRRPNIVMISIDTLRFDCIGYQPCTTYLDRFGVGKASLTPTFDRLAEMSVRFTEAISTSTYTTSSHASVLTGLDPPSHGVRAFYKTTLLPTVPTLAERLSAEGYTCILATDLPELFGPLGLTRGFDSVVAADDADLLNRLDTTHRPLFAFIHLFDVHDPYLWSESKAWQDEHLFEATIKELAAKLGVARPQGQPLAQWRQLIQSLPDKKAPPEVFLPIYLEGVRRFDEGRFSKLVSDLEYRGLIGSGSITLIFADHGEGNYHGHLGHAGPLIDEVLRVPLIMHAPDFAQPRDIHAQVSLTSLAHTVLEILHQGGESDRLEPPAPTLWGPVRGESHAGSSLAYAECWVGSRSFDTQDLLDRNLGDITWSLSERAIRTHGYKLRVRGTPENVLGTPVPAGRTTTELVTHLYRQILKREPDETGLHSHVRALDANSLSAPALLRSLLDSEEFAQQHFLTFDLDAAPFEDVAVSPIPRSRRPVSWRDGWLFGELAQRSRGAKEGPPIMEDESDQDAYSPTERMTIAQRLQNLGYIE